MWFLLLVPVILSLLTLMAHFLREGNMFALGVTLGILIVAFVPRQWSARVVQVVLVLGALEWVRTIFEMMEKYREDGRDPGRMIKILGTVAAVTAASAVAFHTKPLKRFYNRSAPGGFEVQPPK